MKLEEKVALMGLLAAQLQDNVGNRVTHALAHGLLSVVDQNLAVDPPPTMHDLAAPAQPAAEFPPHPGLASAPTGGVPHLID